jgi:hypothetical protein
MLGNINHARKYDLLLLVLPKNNSVKCIYNSPKTSDLSERDDPKQWSGLVFTRDLEQTAVGWQDIIPYPKYVDKRAVWNKIFIFLSLRNMKMTFWFETWLIPSIESYISAVVILTICSLCHLK